MRMVALLLVIVVVVAGCSTSGKPPTDAMRVEKSNYTHVITEETVYYLNGPQQAMPPQGKFSKGTRVTLVRDSGSYAVVTSESGITAYVSTAALKRL